MAWFGELSGKLFGLDIDFGKQSESQLPPPPPPPPTSSAGSSLMGSLGGMMPLIIVGALIYLLVRK